MPKTPIASNQFDNIDNILLKRIIRLNCLSEEHGYCSDMHTP